MRNEMRAATSHQFEYILAGTFRPENIDRVVEDLASHNYNAVQVCVRAPGIHYYPSQIAPVHPYCRDYDFLGHFVDKAHKAGLQIHSYYPVFLEGGEGCAAANGAPPEGGAGDPPLGGSLKEHREWACLIDQDGELKPKNWGCPSNDDYVGYVIRVVEEQVQRYPLDAIIWDFIRFSGHSCYCEQCKSKFRDLTGGEELKVGETSYKEVEFRSHIVLEDLKKLNAAARSVRPTIRTGAYVFPRRGAIWRVCQDWLAFSPDCDLLLPMYYGQLPRGLCEEALRADAQLSHAPLVLGLLPSLGPGVERGTEDALCEDIETARRAGYKGFFMLSYEPLFGWEAAGTYSSAYWHTPHPEGAARRITDRVLSEPADPLW